MALHYSIATLLSVWLVLLYLGTGAFFFRILRIPGTHSFLDPVFKIGTGFGIMGNGVMVLSILQYASAKVITIWLILQTICMIPFIISEIVFVRVYWKKLITTLKNGNVFFSTLLVAILCLYLIRSMLPPTGFDALMYHLSTVDLYLTHGGFYDIFFNPQSDFPMLTEMNFMIGLALGNDIVCGQIALLTFLIAISGVYVLSQFAGLKKNHAILAILLFATATSTIASVPECNVDFALAAWIFSALFLVHRAIELNSERLMLPASFFTGMAMQTKMFGCFGIPLIFLVMYYHKKRPPFKTLMAATMILICMSAPWYIKSFMYNGSILPVSTSTLEGQGLGNPLNCVISNPVIYHIVNIPLRVIAAPWTFSLMPSQHQGDTFGPLLIALFPFLLLFKQSRNLKGLLLLVFGYLLQVLLMEALFIKGGSSIRYSIFIQMIGIPVALAALQQTRTKLPKVGLVLYSFIVIQIALGFLLLAKRYHKDWKAVAFNMPRTEYLRSVLPEYPLIEYINIHCTDGAVMTAYNYSNYYLRCRYLSSYRGYSTESEFVDDMHKLGVKYLFANDKLNTDSNKEAFSILPDKSLVKAENGYFLYRIEDRQ